MGLAKSNAFPSLASNLVLRVRRFMSGTGPHKLQRYVRGVVFYYGLLGSARNIPLAGSV
jgi:hypothetical protein